MKISLIEHLEDEWRIWLKEDFRKMLVKSLSIKFPIKQKLAKRINEPSWLVSEVLNNKALFRWGLVKKMCKLVGVPTSVLLDNITHISLQGIRGRTRFLKEIDITDEFVEWFGLWLGDGDHSNSRSCVGISNNNVNVLKFHLKVLTQVLRIEKERIKVEIWSPENITIDVLKEKWSKSLTIKKSQIGSICFMKHARKDGARLIFWSGVLFSLLRKIKPKLLLLVKNNVKLARAFLKGLFAAEGSCRRKGFEVRLCMGERNMIVFSQELLHKIGINTSKVRFNRWSREFTISITGWSNIKKFHILVGFGHHTEKNDRLSKVIRRIKKLPLKERFRMITEFLEKNEWATTKDIAKFIKTSPSNVRLLLKKMLRKGIVVKDTSKKTFKFKLYIKSL